MFVLIYFNFGSLNSHAWNRNPKENCRHRRYNIQLVFVSIAPKVSRLEISLYGFFIMKCNKVIITLNTNVSLNTGLSVFRCTFVSNFFFLSGNKKTLT